MFGKYTGKCSFWKRKREHARSSSPSFHRRARESYFRSRSIPAAFSGAGKGGGESYHEGWNRRRKGEGGRQASLSLRVLFHAMIRTPPFSVRHVHCVVDKPSAASCMEEEGGGREEGGLVEEE